MELELGGVGAEETLRDLPKREGIDPKQHLQIVIQREARFLQTCREVKVSTWNMILCYKSVQRSMYLGPT